MPNQMNITSGRRRVPYSQAAGVRAGAAGLREGMFLKRQQEMQDQSFDLEERGMEQSQNQFD